MENTESTAPRGPGRVQSGVSHLTDSMVTVSLSDVQSNPELSQPDWQAPSPADSPYGIGYAVTTPSVMDAELPILQPDRYNGSAASIRSRTSDTHDDAVWEELDKSEEQELRGESSDESTALLLARLERENNALATNPKSGLSSTSHAQKQARTQSLHHIKRLMHDSQTSLRYSQLPTPPMTELEFWAALVSNYPQTAQRLPTLTSNKIRGGVPPPLRGVVWPSLAGARDPQLMAEFERLCGETSPYEGLIGKDIGRSFPNVEMFRDPNGEGQAMLARVLKCFSLYDKQIGYCQGLGFVVGPLLMHMSDAEAFCVLVRLMDHYGLRTCYLPDLSGLHLRVYQFQNLLARHRPALHAHLESLNVEPVYVSQWFLSFFAVTCPLPMLLRIYDVIFLEGAIETLMRVALSLMRRNEKKIMAYTEFEDILQFLLSRSMWDTYACHADDLVDDFVSLTSLVSRESLQSLENSYNQSQGVPTGISFPQMQAAASRFLGRLWAGTGSSNNAAKPLSINQSNTIRRSTSKQSMTSTLNSVESSSSDVSTAPTEVSVADTKKPRPKSGMPYSTDRDLHTQIEDLLMALSDLQRQQVDLTRDLQKEREEREEDQEVAKMMMGYIKAGETEKEDYDLDEMVSKAEQRFSGSASRRVSITQTKHQLLDDANRWKDMHKLEAARCMDLNRRVDEQELANSKLKEELREARTRIQEGYNDRQRLERTILELRAGTHHASENNQETVGSPSSETGSEHHSRTGLRELKLVSTKTNSHPTATATAATTSPATPAFNKRSSSLGLQSVLATEHNKPAPEETLLLELVHAKTAEAVAKQELEEVKLKLEALRKLVSGNRAGNKTENRNSFTTVPLSQPNGNVYRTTTEPAKMTNSVHSGGGGFFSGWGRRAPSTSNEL
ncbi:ecotropic viral integration site [Monascus purpureus]|uniref:Ecotropic viral integration site n=1 Tax=Monascus purpureus TaxID=5098 RepID=A0A507QTE7_MONPU|nr:ecotropic viral integration site [Monascus purpureus]